jgi:hypothetical protein
MVNERKDYKPVTTKLELKDFNRLNQTCKLNNAKVSEYVREAILSKLNSGAISHIAGKNEIDYNPKKNNFVWKIILDDGNEIEILKNISGDFVKDLFEQLKLQLKKQEELLGKKNKKSVAVPRGLVKR